MPLRSRISSTMGQIEEEHSELFELEFRKIAEYDFVSTLASANIDQTAQNLVKMYVTIRSRMSLIMGLIGLELSELFALEFAKIAESDCLHSNICNCRPISTKHGHNIYDNDISDEFDSGSNPTVTSGVICP